MHGGDDELRLRDQPILNHIMVNQRAARRLDQPETLPVARRIRDVRVLVIQRIDQNLHGSLDSVDQLDAARQIVEKQRVRRLPEGSVEAL